MASREGKQPNIIESGVGSGMLSQKGILSTHRKKSCWRLRKK